MLIKVGSEIPTDHFVERTWTIAAIYPEQIASTRALIEDVASHSSGMWREFVTFGIVVHMIDGSTFTISGERLNAALLGGGDFWECLPNGEHWAPVTRELYERQIERAEEEAFWDYY